MATLTELVKATTIVDGGVLRHDLKQHHDIFGAYCGLHQGFYVFNRATPWSVSSADSLFQTPEFEKCEELLDDVKDAVQIAQGARFWGPRDHAACFEGVLKACRGRGAWKEARNVLERLENEVTAGNNEDDVEAVERAATASYVAAIGACARNIDDDAQVRWSCARDLLDRLESRLKAPSRTFADAAWRRGCSRARGGRRGAWQAVP